MTVRHAQLVERLRESVLEGPGVVDPAVRAAIEARAARACGRPPGALEPAGAPVPGDLSVFVDRVATGAWTITDEDVAALRRAGRTEDEIFEALATAALGAGMARLERGLAALRGEA